MIFRRNSRKPEPILILPARCAVTGSPFAVRLVVKDGRMVAQEGRKVFPGSSEQEKVNLVKIQTSQGIAVSRTYHCPYCGNKALVECASCGQIACYDESGRSTCPTCGRTNQVGGTIESVAVYNPGAKPEPKY